MPGKTERSLEELYARDPERADAEVFGRQTGVDRRGFLGGAGLAAMSAALGGANEASVSDSARWGRFSALEADLSSRFCPVPAWLAVMHTTAALAIDGSRQGWPGRWRR